MNYPFWDIPILGSGWVIGLIAIFHVMISQFAVGGGFYLPIAERKAQRMTDPVMREAWLAQLVRHSKFFLILTGVFGTVSGVGIWFAIGLTHPEATSTLIHNFVFGWAMAAADRASRRRGSPSQTGPGAWSGKSPAHRRPR